MCGIINFLYGIGTSVIDIKCVCVYAASVVDKLVEHAHAHELFLIAVVVYDFLLNEQNRQ